MSASGEPWPALPPEISDRHVKGVLDWIVEAQRIGLDIEELRQACSLDLAERERVNGRLPIEIVKGPDSPLVVPGTPP